MTTPPSIDAAKVAALPAGAAGRVTLIAKVARQHALAHRPVSLNAGH